MSVTQEYIVTAKTMDDATSLLDDLETPGGDLYIPDRAVEVAQRREISRNTHFLLTAEEAEQVRNDPRVLAVELLPSLQGLEALPHWTQTGNFEKSSTIDTNDKNWGLYRTIAGLPLATWGTNGSFTQTAQTISTTSSGKNVDVVVVDSHINFNHPEFAVSSDVTTFVFQNAGFNYSVDGFADTTFPDLTLVRGQLYNFNFTNVSGSHPIALRLANGSTTAVPGTTGNNASVGVNGIIVTYQVPLDAPSTIYYQCAVHGSMIGTINITGGSRAIQYNWFQHSAALGYGSTGTYNYSSISSAHGTHVAGTMAGNTQGWARDANIYNMEFIYAGGNGPAGDWTTYLFDYIRAFHNTKPINPVTGKRNPTITNNSWGYSSFSGSLTNVTSVTYRGVTTAVTGTTAEKRTILQANGVPVPFSTQLYRTPARSSALDADIQDAIADGVLVISSAGNSYWNCATSDLADYNNTFINSGSTYFHSRGSSPSAADQVICVGSLGTTTQEYKSSFSNYGKRVDIWAPGSNIVSAVYDANAATEFGITLANDPRDSAYKLGSISGTSMSGPQVAGYLACLLEQYPNMRQTEALQHLATNSTKNQIGSTGGAAGDYTSLGDNSYNRHLYYVPLRPVTGTVSPMARYKDRPTTGVAYPRSRIRRYG